MPVGATTAPVVDYIDTTSAPTTGGENGAGGYLSIFGSNFGAASALGTTTKVYIGGVEVANYRYLGAAKVGAKLGLQQITVQVGSLAGEAVGKAEPIEVVVNSVASNVNNTFTPTAGKVWFVSLTGNDTTAVAGDITHPLRSLQNMTTLKGAYFSMGAGDQVVIRGGSWNDTNGVDTSWMKFGAGIYARNGTPSAYISFTAYPGPIKGNAIEDVHYTTPSGASGGFQGPWSAIAGTSGEYIAVSNMRMEVAGGANRDAAPINFQYTGGHWRAVNNEIGPWVAGNSAILNAAGISGHGDGNVLMGNNIHDIQGLSDQQNHGIYADTTAENWQVAYNWIHNMTGGSAIQFNDNQGGAGTYAMPHGGTWPGFVNIQIHHNWIERRGQVRRQLQRPDVGEGGHVQRHDLGQRHHRHGPARAAHQLDAAHAAALVRVQHDLQLHDDVVGYRQRLCPPRRLVGASGCQQHLLRQHLRVRPEHGERHAVVRQRRRHRGVYNDLQLQTQCLLCQRTVAVRRHQHR